MMTDKLRGAAQAALEWLRDERLNTWVYMDSQFFEDRNKQAEALEAALAEQKPMLEMNPQKREWVGLTGDEIEDLPKDQTWWEIIRAAEAKLREKNGG